MMNKNKEKKTIQFETRYSQWVSSFSNISRPSSRPNQPKGFQHNTDDRIDTEETTTITFYNQNESISDKRHSAVPSLFKNDPPPTNRSPLAFCGCAENLAESAAELKNRSSSGALRFITPKPEGSKSKPNPIDRWQQLSSTTTSLTKTSSNDTRHIMGIGGRSGNIPSLLNAASSENATNSVFTTNSTVELNSYYAEADMPWFSSSTSRRTMGMMPSRASRSSEIHSTRTVNHSRLPGDPQRSHVDYRRRSMLTSSKHQVLHKVGRFHSIQNENDMTPTNKRSFNLGRQRGVILSPSGEEKMSSYPFDPFTDDAEVAEEYTVTTVDTGPFPAPSLRQTREHPSSPSERLQTLSTSYFLPPSSHDEGKDPRRTNLTPPELRQRPHRLQYPSVVARDQQNPQRRTPLGEITRDPGSYLQSNKSSHFSNQNANYCSAQAPRTRKGRGHPWREDYNASFEKWEEMETIYDDESSEYSSINNILERYRPDTVTRTNPSVMTRNHEYKAIENGSTPDRLDYSNFSFDVISEITDEQPLHQLESFDSLLRKPNIHRSCGTMTAYRIRDAEDNGEDEIVFDEKETDKCISKSGETRKQAVICETQNEKIFDDDDDNKTDSSDRSLLDMVFNDFPASMADAKQSWKQIWNVFVIKEKHIDAVVSKIDKVKRQMDEYATSMVSHYQERQNQTPREQSFQYGHDTDDAFNSNVVEATQVEHSKVYFRKGGDKKISDHMQSVLNSEI